jgi:hypothetical protein
VLGNASAVACGPTSTPPLALAGTRALWVETEAGNEEYDHVVTGAPGQRQRELAMTVGSSLGGDGDYVTDIAGDGATLAYSVVHMRRLDTCIDPGTPCNYFADSGRVRRVVGRSTRLVPKMPPTVKLAVSGRRIAVVVASPKGPDPQVTPTAWVEVHDAVSDALVTSFAANGLPVDLGLGPRYVAVLVNGRCLHCRLIEWHSARSGKSLGVTSVPLNATDLAMSGRNVVFRSGRSIRYAAALDEQARLIAVAASTPVGLSIEGGRVFWGERVRGTSRIVSVAVD